MYSPTDIIEDILMWPSAVFDEIGKKQYVATAVGLAVPLYFVGIPNADMDFYQMAYWYAITGVGVAGAKALIGEM